MFIISIASFTKINFRRLKCYGNFNSYVLDYSARQKASGGNLNFYVVKQLPILQQDQLPRNQEVGSIYWSSARVIELSYTAWDLEAFGADCGYDGPPFRWDEERRFQIRCELDAAYFHLYLGSDDQWGVDSPTLREMFPTPRDAVDYIMDTFPIVRRKDEAKYEGEYKTKTTILKIYDQMAEAIRTGQPYQTNLNPPPGPPTDSEGNFIPFHEWTTDLDTSHIHPPHIERKRVEQGRLVLDLLLLLDAWKQPVSITAIEPALILMRNEAARKTLLTQELKPQEAADLQGEPRFITGIDRVYQALETNGTIRRVGENGYELVKPELLTDASHADRKRAAEVIQAVSRLGDLRALCDVVAELTDERYEVTV